MVVIGKLFVCTFVACYYKFLTCFQINVILNAVMDTVPTCAILQCCRMLVINVSIWISSGGPNAVMDTVPTCASLQCCKMLVKSVNIWISSGDVCKGENNSISAATVTSKC